MGGAADFVQSACLALGLSEGTTEAVCRYTPVLLQAAGYMGMAFFAWNALRFRLGRRSSLILALAFTSLAAVLDECHQILVPGRYPRVTDWLIDMAGAAVLVAGIWLFQVLWNRFPKLVNRETVSYVVFGVLTTVVNIVVYQLCYTALPLGDVARNAVSNTAAFILALIFAYVVNKLFVFQSKTHGLRELLWEAGKFARGADPVLCGGYGGDAAAGERPARAQRPVQDLHECHRHDHELSVQQVVYFQGQNTGRRRQRRKSRKSDKKRRGRPFPSFYIAPSFCAY